MQTGGELRHGLSTDLGHSLLFFVWKRQYFLPHLHFSETQGQLVRSGETVQWKFFKDLGKIKSFYFTWVDCTLQQIILESNQALLLDWNESFSFYIQCQISGVDYVFDITFSRDFSLAER